MSRIILQKTEMMNAISPIDSLSPGKSDHYSGTIVFKYAFGIDGKGFAIVEVLNRIADALLDDVVPIDHEVV